MQILKFKTANQEIGERLDKMLTERLSQTAPTLSLSRVRVQQLIKDGYVLVNDKPGKSSYRMEGDESITVHLAHEIIAPPDANAAVIPESLPLKILYEDESIAAIDKSAGMVVHPAAGHTHGTLVNAILARWPQTAQVGGDNRAGIVHRLDMDTSGVILIAKTEAARLALMSQFAARTVQKRYIALVVGLPNARSGEINVPLGRDPNKRKQMAAIPTNRGGRESVTHFRILTTYEGFTLLEALPKTGRTHQIRVHLAFIGHPIAGDRVYGPRKQKIRLDRHFLHAESLRFVAPSTGQSLTVSTPLPPELQRVLDRLTEI